MLWACAIDAFDTKALAAPPGFSAEWPYFVSGTCCDIMGFDASQDVAGPTGNLVSVIGSGGTQPLIDNWFGELIALQPGTSSAPTPAPSPGATPTPVTDALTVRPRSVNFGNLVKGITGDSRQAAITISNGKGSKRVPIILGSPSITAVDANGDYQVDLSGTCADGMTLAPGEACTIALQFSPMAVKASKATLTVPNTGSRGRSLTIGLRGGGVLGRLTRKPTSLNFHKVLVEAPSVPLSVILTNRNAVSIAIDPVRVTGREAAEFAPDPSACGAGVPPNGSCAINVTLTPGKKGARSATLEITTGGTPSLIKVPLSGVGE